MSNDNFTDFPSAYPSMAISREAAIDTINALQVDLTLLADWLARDSAPAMLSSAVTLLAGVQYELETLHPSMWRH